MQLLHIIPLLEKFAFEKLFKNIILWLTRK